MRNLLARLDASTDANNKMKKVLVEMSSASKMRYGNWCRHCFLSDRTLIQCMLFGEHGSFCITSFWQRSAGGTPGSRHSGGVHALK